MLGEVSPVALAVVLGMSLVTVRLLDGGPTEWVAGIAVVLVAHRTENVLLAMAAGVGTLLVIRSGVLE